MSKGLKRYYGEGHLHFITCSCDRRRPLLSTPARRDLFLRILEQVRRRYRFQVVGYVVMPEHFHLLMSEPEQGDLSLVMQVLKQRVARRLLAGRERARSQAQLGLWDEGGPEGEHFWQRRFYDFNVWSKRKRIEKLRSMHRNPVKRGLVASPDLWPWSSFRCYAYGESGVVQVEPWPVARPAGVAGR
ncbi:MAG TPA: transposase [Terriglobales bacterium]|nr:transposase [Terriglobales bacterium]